MKTMVGFFGFNPPCVVPMDFFRYFKNYLGFLSHKIFKFKIPFFVTVSSRHSPNHRGSTQSSDMAWHW
jgi:hypothetical protein